jgi:hypothetical protein
MNLISWVKDSYFRKFYNLITVTVPFDYKMLNNYVIAEIKIKNDDIKIVLIKKGPLQ